MPGLMFDGVGGVQRRRPLHLKFILPLLAVFHKWTIGQRPRHLSNLEPNQHIQDCHEGNPKQRPPQTKLEKNIITTIIILQLMPFAVMFMVSYRCLDSNVPTRLNQASVPVACIPGWPSESENPGCATDSDKNYDLNHMSYGQHSL